MPRVRRPTAPPPPPDPDRVAVPVPSLPAAVQSTAAWIDRAMGDDDGALSRGELNAYERTYGSDAGHATTIAQLERAFSLGTVSHPIDPASAAIAKRLVLTGGSGSPEDAAAVAGALSAFPVEVLRTIENANLHVVACRGGVTDYLTDLRNVQPRGWPPGSTWDSVPGTFRQELGQVVIATTEKNGARVVPDFGQGQGSFNLVFHETGHAIDRLNLFGSTSESRAFVSAYEADRLALGTHHEDYLLQPGTGGHEETWAEMEARYFSHDPLMHTSYPHLDAYFAGLARSLGIPS